MMEGSKLYSASGATACGTPVAEKAGDQRVGALSRSQVLRIAKLLSIDSLGFRGHGNSVESVEDCLSPSWSNKPL